MVETPSPFHIELKQVMLSEDVCSQPTPSVSLLVSDSWIQAQQTQQNQQNWLQERKYDRTKALLLPTVWLSVEATWEI